MRVVYFIYSEALAAVKIGLTDNLQKRLETLQTANASTLTVIGSVPSVFGLERALHHEYRARRIRGEWFSVSPEEARTCIERIRREGPMHLLPESPTRAPSWAELLRNKIETSGQTRYAISQATGIGQNMLSRLMAGKTISLQTAERLAAHFGLELSERRKDSRK